MEQIFYILCVKDILSLKSDRLLIMIQNAIECFEILI